MLIYTLVIIWLTTVNIGLGNICSGVSSPINVFNATAYAFDDAVAITHPLSQPATAFIYQGQNQIMISVDGGSMSGGRRDFLCFLQFRGCL